VFKGHLSGDRRVGRGNWGEISGVRSVGIGEWGEVSGECVGAQAHLRCTRACSTIWYLCIHLYLYVDQYLSRHQSRILSHAYRCGHTGVLPPRECSQSWMDARSAVTCRARLVLPQGAPALGPSVF